MAAASVMAKETVVSGFEMKQKIFSITVLSIFILVLTLNIISSVNVQSVSVDKLYPGKAGKVIIDVENNIGDDVEDVSFTLNINQQATPGFSTQGTSEKSQDSINDGDQESFSFALKVGNDVKPGDYNIPYTIKYKNTDTEEIVTKTGSFGVSVGAQTELDFSVETKDAIVGKQGKVTLEIINSGLGEIKSVSVDINPEGFEVLSKEKVFVGTVNAEDSDIVTWDVLFEDDNPTLNAVITYKDFDNSDQTKSISLPVKVYTQEEALKAGLIKKSKVGIYFGIFIALILIWIIYRQLKKRNRKKRNSENGR